MEKWLVGHGAATSGVCRVFDHEAPVAVVFYVRDHLRFAHTAQAHNALALLQSSLIYTPHLHRK
jgi:hypothetical protein